MANLTTALGLYFFTCGLASVAGPIIVGAENIISPFLILIFDLVRLLGVFHISPWFHTYQQSPYPMLLCQARYSTCGAATRRASTSRAAAWRPPLSASPHRRCWAPAAAPATPSPRRRRWSRRRGGAMMGSQVCCNFGISRNMHDSYIQNTEQIIPHPAMSNKHIEPVLVCWGFL